MALTKVTPEELAMLNGTKLTRVSPSELAALNAKPKNNLKASVLAGVTDLIGGPGDMLTAALQKSQMLGSGLRPVLGINKFGVDASPDVYPSESLRQGLGMAGVDASPDANYWQQWPIRFGVSSLMPGGGLKGALVQGGSGAASGLLFAGAREVAPDNQYLQVAATLLPQAAHTAATGAVRRVARGGEKGRLEMEANLDRTKAVMGEEGPLSSVLPGNVRKEVAGWIEKALSYVPGAGFPVRAKGERIQQGMGETLDRASGGSVSDKYEGGAAIKQGLFGDGGANQGWIGKFESIGRANYDKLFSHFNPQDTLTPEGFMGALKDLSGKFSTEQMNAVFGDPRYAKWAEAVSPSSTPSVVSGTKTVSLPGEMDALSLSGPAPQRNTTVPNVVSPGRPQSLDPLTSQPLPAKMTFSDAKGIRTRLGKLLSKPELVSGFDTAEIEQLYGALSGDLSKAAWAKGGTAWSDWEAANKHWYEGRQDIKNTLDPIKNLPEERLFETIFSPKDGYERLLKLKGMIGTEKWETAVDTLAARMGTPAPSKDLFGNILPEKFSSETFLTNYNRMPDRNKGAVFGYGERRKALDALAKSAADLRKTSQSLANPSGTAGAGLAGLLFKQAMAASVTFALGDLATLGGSTAAGYYAAKKLMDPKFARWLAQSNKIPPQSLPGHISRLRIIAQNANDKELEAIADELEKQNSTRQ